MDQGEHVPCKQVKMKTRSQVVKTRINKILHDQTYHGYKRFKEVHISTSRCNLCGVKDHIYIYSMNTHMQQYCSKLGDGVAINNT